MDYTINEVLTFIEENDVKFIKLAFCDIFGTQKNISIMAEELPRAFQQGISFDASAVKGFMNVEESDLYLYPDPSTLCILPWRPQHGRVMRMFCEIRHPDGTPFEGDGRAILKGAVAQAKAMGYTCKIGAECEFYLFELDEKGNPTKIPHDQAGYCDIAPQDKGENVRREICLTLEEMGIRPESSHHEQGPGQNEVDMRYNEALAAADELITFKSVVKTIAARNGLFASFMPKPLKNQSGNGLHINLSLFKGEENLFKTDRIAHSQEAESFVQGILSRVAELTIFLNPLTNSYRRFGEYEAPKYITWSHQNRSQLIRIPAASGAQSRMELRSPDPACNPYLAFALLIYAGLEGITNQVKLSDPVDCNLYTASKERLAGIVCLPKDLESALEIAQNSLFVKSNLPESVLNNYIKAKQEEWLVFQSASNQQEQEDDLYFFRG